MVSIVDRQAHVLGPIPPWAPCSQAYGVNNDTNLSIFPTIHPEVDTTAIEPIALSAIGSSFLANYTKSAIYYTMGNQPFATFGWDAFEWLVSFTECGVSGAPVQSPAPLGSSWINASSAQLDLTFTGAFSCTGSSYSVNLTGDGALVPTVTLAVCGKLNSSSPSLCGTPSALSSMAIEPIVVTSTGAPLTPSPSLCREWVENVSDCSTPASGWYAVLTTPSGQWLDSYPGASGSGWVAPNVDIEGGDLLQFVVGPGLTLSGDDLNMQATSSIPTITCNTITL